MGKIAIGLDVGGSHIKSAAVNLSDNKIIKESISESEVDNQAAADVILDIWISTIKKTIAFVGAENLAGIGFGMPGPFDYEKGIALFENVLKYDNLYGINVAERIRADLGLEDQFPVRFINDATAFAVGEAWMGQGAGFSRAIAITLGSGLGSAFVADGIPVVTGDEVPEIGAVWHLPFKDSIANDYVCTTWFITEYKKITGKEVKGVKELAQIYDEDQVVRDLFNEFGRSLGTILLPWLKKFNADVIILGGNITGAFSLFKSELLSAIESTKAQVKISELKEDAALLGSARLIDETFFERVGPALKHMK